jgi:hypothetical protein
LYLDVLGVTMEYSFLLKPVKNVPLELVPVSIFEKGLLFGMFDKKGIKLFWKSIYSLTEAEF